MSKDSKVCYINVALTELESRELSYGNHVIKDYELDSEPIILNIWVETTKKRIIPLNGHG